MLPSQTITWGEWKRLHPDTRLLAFDDGQPFPPFEGSDPLGSYLIRIDQGDFIVPVAELDERLRPSEAVVTVEVGSAVKAYPLRLIGQGVVNDTVGGQPVAVFVYKKGVTGSAFMATVAGSKLTFQFQDDRITDRETGSTWNGAGQAVAGPLQGTTLEPVPTRRALWFSIAGAFPGLELYLP